MNYKTAVIIFFAVILLASTFLAKNFDFFKKISADISNSITPQEKIINIVKTNKHLAISPQKGVYSTIWSARSKKIDDLISLADGTEVNALVIDVKDSGYYIDDNIKNLVSELHSKNIYAIARVVVFQDSSQVKAHPDWYFKNSNGSLWRDKRGWYWMNPENREVWDYNLNVAKRAIDAGFDEVNFDYIRFPAFLKTDDVVLNTGSQTISMSQAIDNFASYLTLELKKYDPGIKLSVDLFAYNMLNGSDLGIGQRFTELYSYFDYVSPMIYPSHYLPGNFGFQNPAEHPYEVVLDTIKKGEDQLHAVAVSETGTTTPSIVDPVYGKELKKLRPWLQDFNIGAVYDGEMIRKEKQAVYDAGLTSGWLLWNPNNVYTKSALDSQ